MERCQCGNILRTDQEQSRRVCLECGMAREYFVNQLPVPVPPMLEQACGYDEKVASTYVAFFWDAGDEAYVADGRISATGEWDGYLLFTQHPLILPYLVRVDLGSSEAPAKHWMVLNRQTRELFVMEKQLAQELLERQWPAGPGLTPEQIAEIENNLLQYLEQKKNVLPQDADIIAIMIAHQQVVQEMSEWLDTHYKEVEHVAMA